LHHGPVIHLEKNVAMNVLQLIQFFFQSGDSIPSETMLIVIQESKMATIEFTNSQTSKETQFWEKSVLQTDESAKLGSSFAVAVADSSIVFRDGGKVDAVSFAAITLLERPLNLL